MCSEIKNKHDEIEKKIKTKSCVIMNTREHVSHLNKKKMLFNSMVIVTDKAQSYIEHWTGELSFKAFNKFYSDRIFFIKRMLPSVAKNVAIKTISRQNVNIEFKGQYTDV